MKKIILLAVWSLVLISVSGQTKQPPSEMEIIKDISDNACKCIDSISTQNKDRNDISKEISKCIDKRVVVYQMSSKWAEFESSTINDPQQKKEVTIRLSDDPQSVEYQRYYRRIERYLMDSCQVLKNITIKQDNKESENSISSNPKAKEEYDKGINYFKTNNYKKALPYFKKAVSYDENFAFAWDNLGVCYSNLGDYDKAIAAYQKSLSLDPEGITPLINIPVVYQRQKDYDKAIEAYKNLQKAYPDNPEGFYGAGITFLSQDKDEEALDEMCQAYHLYIEEKSPYRTDAERLIQMIYNRAKDKDQVKKYDKILQKYRISKVKE